MGDNMEEKHCWCGLPATHEGPSCCYHYERQIRAEIEVIEARADACQRVTALTEKYHNEDMLLMQEMEKVIVAARLLVSGPDAQGYSRLSGAIDRYEQARRERDRTY